MCGIAYRDSEQVVKHDKLKRMSDSLAHRGPDGDGIWTAKLLGIAHRRLSILDLSDDAKQPMPTTDGNCQITFNGKIHQMVVRPKHETLGLNMLPVTELRFWTLMMFGSKKNS